MKNKSSSATKNIHYKIACPEVHLVTTWKLTIHASLHFMFCTSKYARRGGRLQFLLVLLAVDDGKEWIVPWCASRNSLLSFSAKFSFVTAS